jgi:hypothetical protein
VTDDGRDDRNGARAKDSTADGGSIGEAETGDVSNGDRSSAAGGPGAGAMEARAAGGGRGGGVRGASSTAAPRGAAGSPAADERRVILGSEGFQPGAGDDPRTTAGLEEAVPDADDRFDWRGWLLVGVVVVCFLLIPGIILLRPIRVVGFRTTYLVLPLLPAVLLGATAVWVAVRSRRGDR